MNRGRLILVRHGETELNRGATGDSAERVRGQSNVPLDEEGRAEAHSLSHELTAANLSCVYSSPLERARVTADWIGRMSALEVTDDERLLPWDTGYMTGQEIRKVLPAIQWYTKYENAKPAKGESFGEFRRRFLSRLLELLHETADGTKNCCAVTHSRNLHCARAWIAAGSPRDLHVDLDVMNDYATHKQEDTGTTLELVPFRSEQ